MNPQVVCSVAGLCNNARFKSLLNEPGKNVIKKQTAPNTCDGCHTVVGLLEDKFQKMSRDQVLQSFLHVSPARYLQIHFISCTFNPELSTKAYAFRLIFNKQTNKENRFTKLKNNLSLRFVERCPAYQMLVATSSLLISQRSILIYKKT